MEDTASIVTPFINLQCGVSGKCKSETDPHWQLPSDFHFFGVYDGHGGPEASRFITRHMFPNIECKRYSVTQYAFVNLVKMCVKRILN